MKYTVGIDIGTSGTKTVLFDEMGTPIASHTIEYPLYQPKNGWAEQDPKDWWNAAVSTIKTVLAKSGVNKDDVVSLGISGQMHGLVMLDAEGNVLGETGLLEPGQYVRSLRLDTVPKKDGLVTARILTYEPDTYYSLGSANAQIILQGIE